MTTRQTIEAYLEALRNGKEWNAFFADNVEFTSFTSPVRTLNGKPAFLEGAKRFYSSIASMTVRGLLVEGDRGCALTRYQLRSPDGGTFDSDVAEIYSVGDGRITSFGIYFDTAPYPAPKPAPEGVKK